MKSLSKRNLNIDRKELRTESCGYQRKSCYRQKGNVSAKVLGQEEDLAFLENSKTANMTGGK